MVPSRKVARDFGCVIVSRPVVQVHQECEFVENEEGMREGGKAAKDS